MADKLRITQVKSTISHIARNRATIEALRGLHSAEELGRRRGIKLVSRISGQPAPTALEGADGR